ncbi:ureidoglycolate lyase [Sagittula sp. NFXS13]|uniref:ureidoglycolate lyase n=1 Tax=Sagittula sp. NFXS13 TaxID=2819095 RepID=UPI0032E014A3
MTLDHIQIKPLTAVDFSAFGDVLEAAGIPDRLINQGMGGRFHDRALLDFGPDGRAGISIFDAEPRDLPYHLNILERHPEGSQAFIPMHSNEWLVIVAEAGDTPGPVHAFRVPPGVGVNFHKGTWHGVLTPLHVPGLFAVIDRIGETSNLQECRLPVPLVITK